MPSDSNEQGGTLKLLDKNIRSIFIIFISTFGIWRILLPIVIEIQKSQQIGLIEQSAVLGYYLLTIILGVCGICVLFYVIISGIKLIKSWKKEGIEEKSETKTQIETELRVCPECSGNGNIPCPNLDCEEGFIHFSPFKIRNGRLISKEKCSTCIGKSTIICRMCKGEGKI
jgi:hypothetical protein